MMTNNGMTDPPVGLKKFITFKNTEMKKLFLAIACLASLLSAVSCQKEIIDNVGTSAGKGTVITLTVEDSAVCKSAFDGDKTISLTGDEHFNVFYVGAGGKTAGNVEATPSGQGVYSFVVPGGVNVEDYSWYAVSPYSPGVQAKGTTAENNAQLWLSPVQVPGANTFDANFDFLLSNKLEVSEGVATITEFKRLAAPLLLSIKGLEAGDKIFAATLTIDEPAPGNASFTGNYKIKFSEDFSEAGMKSITYRGNGVSAIYADGLEAIGGEWPVWFMVGPYTLRTGVIMTVTVTTATKTYTRSVRLPENKNLVTSSISKISFNVKGEGYSEKQTIFQAFTKKETADAIRGTMTPTLTASNGGSYTWKFSRGECAMTSKDVDPGMPYGLMLSAASGTMKFLYIPGFGKNVVAAHFFIHTANSGITEASCYTEAPYKNEMKGIIYPAPDPLISDIPFGNSLLTNQGGKASITLPDDGPETLAGLVLVPTGTVNIAAALFEVSVDVNDYYDMYNVGVDFKIGDKTINQSTYPTAVLKGTDLALTDITSGSGILFIDNSEEIYIENEGNISISKDKVIIGRYSNKPQPVIKQTATVSNYIRPLGGNYLKNIRMESAGTGHFVSAAVDAGNSCSFVCEDCTIICAGTLLYEGNKDRKFGDVVFNNCVIENAGEGLIAASGTKDGTLGGDQILGSENSITLTNCVVSTKSSDGGQANVNANLLDFSASKLTDTPVKITLTGNTFVGFGKEIGTALVSSKTIGGFDIQKNIFVGGWAGGICRVIKTAIDQDYEPDPRNISYNYGQKAGAQLSETDGDSQMHWNPEDHEVKLSYTNKGNKWDSTASPFTDKVDYTNLYFPVDTEVVVNGAGATYSTKLWTDWTR